MKRRDAIRNMIAVSAGIAVLPACDFETFKVYENIPLEKEQYKMIRAVSETILPTGELEVPQPESTLDYILTMVNDCYEPEDVEKYASGVSAFQQYMAKNHEQLFRKVEEGELDILKSIGPDFTEPIPPKKELSPIQYFITTTKNLTQKHFTSSEYYLTNYMDYEFVPSRYLGSVKI